MESNALTIDSPAIRKLLAAANGDAALLYIYVHSGNDPEQAGELLHMSVSRLACAQAALRQLDLWPQQRQRPVFSGERPSYSETDVLQAMNTEGDFRALYGEVQRQLGRSLNTEELKILLGFVRYLGLPADVITVLICYCKDRARQRGNLRNPSLRAIEKEAYAWAERGIDTLEEAAAFIQQQNRRHSRLAKLMEILQIRGRNLTAAEERYAAGWLEMGFDEETISAAYERTCLNTGGLNWAYMNKILTRWHEAGQHTLAQVQAGDRMPGVKMGQRHLDEDEKLAIARMMRED